MLLTPYHKLPLYLFYGFANGVQPGNIDDAAQVAADRGADLPFDWLPLGVVPLKGSPALDGIAENATRKNTDRRLTVRYRDFPQPPGAEAIRGSMLY